MRMMHTVMSMLVVALAACTEAGPRDLVGPENAKPRLNHVAYVNVCCPATVYQGTRYQVYAYVYDWDGQPVYNQTVGWSTSGNGVASIWGSTDVATVEAVGLGTTTIYANVGGAIGSTTLTVTAAPVVTTVQITPSPVAVQVGESRQLTAAAFDQYGNQMSGKTASWTIDHPGVASISSTGNLQGVAAGSTTARATIDGVSGSAPVTVNPYMAVSISGPAWISSPGYHQWTANVSGGSGSTTYQWYTETNGIKQPLGTGSTQTIWVDQDSPSYFILSVEATSGTQTVEAYEYICNMMVGMSC